MRQQALGPEYALFAHYHDTVADGVVNDRWTQVRLPANRLARALCLGFISLALKALGRVGRPLPPQVPSFCYDFQTYEYAIPDPAPTRPWELTRGLGRSFGYNAQETAADTLSGTQLAHLLIDVVAHGGNCSSTSAPTAPGASPRSSGNRSESSATGWSATARPSTRPARGPARRTPRPPASRSVTPKTTASSTPSSWPTG
jgi:hypothetical protein